MSRILAPSNLGYKMQELQGLGQGTLWNTPYNPNYWNLRKVTYLMSYKGPTTKSDKVHPTNYVRMISKLVNGGPYEAFEPKKVRKRKNLSISDTVSVVARPYGCNIPVGGVSVPTWMTDKVTADAIAEMNQIGANIYEDLGQLKQTGDMIAMLVKVIYDLYLAARKGQFKYVRRALNKLGSTVPKRIANGWLMYFYGIKPLISTIDALCSSAKPAYTNLTVRKRVEIAVDPKEYTNADGYVTCSGTAKIQAQCELAASIKMDGNTRYWANLGVTADSFTDAAVTAWALVPYSFVFDWFIPVEQFLRSLSWSSSLNYQWGYVGRRHEAKADLKDLHPDYGGYPYNGKLPSYSLQVKFYSRRTYPYNVPPVYLGIRLGLSSTQIISAAALITQRS